MWLQIYFVAVTAISIEAIKVRVENENKNNPAPIQMQLPTIDQHSQTIPIYYANDGANIESFLVPQNLPKQAEILQDVLVTPAGYLLPPAVAPQNEFYYKPTEPGEQTDWYPIAASPQKQIEVTRDERPVQEVRNLRTPKAFERSQIVPIPARDLLPPREDAVNHFVVLPPSELPSDEKDHTITVNPNVLIPNGAHVIKYPVKLQPHSVLPLDYITPPKNPTRLYPKKYQSEFRPVPIPISQVDEATDDVHDERPSNVNNEYPSNPQYEVEEKQNLKGDQDGKVTDSDDETPREIRPLEQDTRTSASHHGQPEHYAYTYPSKQAPFASQKQKPSKSNGERTEFRMHGMKGPNSYQFGFDTGKGKNRQFRYEERDNDGHVRGHYGYVDKFGKLRVVNYDADPKLGFRAEVPPEKE